MTTVHVEYFGFAGEGPTVKAAKEDAGKKITALHRDNWTPVIREWRGHAALVFRTLRGWEYRFIARPGELPPLQIPHGSSCGYSDRAEAIAAAERHVAANGWEPTDPLDAFPVWFGTADNREHAAVRREMIDQRKWYKQMHHLHHECGIADETARRMIAGLEHLPEGVSLLTF